MARVKALLRLAFALAAGLALLWLGLNGSQLPMTERLGQSADSRAAFADWAQQDPERLILFAELEGFLSAEGVAEVVPAWQLARIDGQYARRCDIGYFAMPPRELWPNIVPALELVRDHVVPAVGPVEVLSSYRTPELNACVSGASGSKHLGFFALDLGTHEKRKGADLYRELCVMQRAAGPRSRMGLGAYFRNHEPERGSGRFHIDREGYRTWGPDYTMATDPCPKLVQQEGQ